MARRLLSAHLGLLYLFLYGPILVLMVLSFNKEGLPTVWSGFSTDWYLKLAENEKILGAALNTLIVGLGSTAIAAVLGTLLALGIEARSKKSGTLEALLFAPMIIPDVVLAIALLSFYSFLQFTLGLHSIVMSHVVFCLAFVCAVVRTRLKHFDWAVLEASEDLGASSFTTFRRVTLPMIFPGVLAGALLSFTLSIDEFIIAYFSASPTSTTLPMQVYSMIRFGVTPEINALATIVMLISFTMVFFSQRLTRPPQEAT